MNVMHLISGGDSGGAKTHLFELFDKLVDKCNVSVACLMKGVFYNEILEKNIETILFEQKNRFDLSVVGDIAKEIKTRKIDILHVHGARANFIAMFLKKRISVPVVSTIHSDPLLDFDSFVKKLVFTNLNRFSLRKIDYFITVSDNFKDMMISRGFRPNSLYPVYNGMNFNRVPEKITSKQEYAATHGLDIDENLIYVGIAARFDLVKGVDVFVRGAAKAYETNKNLRFLIAGDGAEKENLINLAKSLGVSDVVHFLGFERDIYGFLNFIDINTLTSFCESFPYSMLEGAAMKKPMIASCVGGIPHLVRDGRTGYLFESKNSDDMAEKLLLLASDKSEIKRMGEEIFCTVTTLFSSEAFASRHMEIYSRIIADFKSKKKYDFILSGYYGFNNSGDDALLLALINDLKEYKPDVRIAVLSQKRKMTEKLYRVDAISRMNPLDVGRAIKNSKVLLSGGGSLIQDETSSKSLWYYLAIIKNAGKKGVGVMQIANGIGPVSREKNRRLAAKIINENVDMITLRESKSYNEINAMHINVECEVTADPAISLSGVDKERVEQIFKSNSVEAGEYVCIALRDWKYMHPGFKSDMAKFLDYIKDTYSKNIVFVPMQYPVDMEISEQISAMMKNRAYIIKTPCTIEETIGIIKYSSLVVAMRLHSLVYAVSCGVGVIAVKYDPKIDGFMEYFKQELIVDVCDTDYDEMKLLADKFFESTDNAQITRLCSEMKNKAKRNAQKAIELLEKYDG